MLYEIFFSPLSDAIDATRAYTAPATSLIPHGSCGTPASKLWLALSQVPVAIVQDAIYEALSSIKYVPEPTPKTEPSKPTTPKEKFYGSAIDILASSIEFGEPAPEPPSPAEIEALPFPEIPQAPAPVDSKTEDVGNGGTWKPSAANPSRGFGIKEYSNKPEADYYRKQSEIWCYAARVVQVTKGCYRLEAGDIDRDRWTKICRGNPNRLARQPKPKRERPTESQQSKKRQLELEPIAELRDKFRRALMRGFHPSFTVSTISRDHLVRALVEATDWELSQAA